MVEIQYLGQCGFRIRLGDLCLVTDPCLSYFLDETDKGGELVWERAYPPAATLRQIAPDVVLISHAHVDHMDPWTLEEYAKSGETCMMIVPKPEAYRMAEWGFGDVTKARAWEEITCGDVSIIPIPCAHRQLHQDENGDYYELSYMIMYQGTKLFFAGDMSLYEGIEDYLKKEKPQIMLLPVNGSTERLTALGVIGNLSCCEAAKLAADVGTKVYIPMHHDLYPVNGCSYEDIRASAAELNAPLDLIEPGGIRTYEL